MNETKHSFDLLSSADKDVGYRGIMESMVCLLIREPVSVGSAIPVTSLGA